MKKNAYLFLLFLVSSISSSTPLFASLEQAKSYQFPGNYLAENLYANPTILQAFYWYIPDPDSGHKGPESNLWQYISYTMADEFKQHGFTHVWLPPMSKAFSPTNEYNVGYAVYDHYDLGEFHQMGRVRTKYGTKQELLAAVEALHSRGIMVIGDIVMNHMLGADQAENVPYSHGFIVNKNNTVSYIGSGEIAAYLNFNFQNKNDPDPRGTRHSSFVWNKDHFNGLEIFDRFYLFQGKSINKVAYFGDLSSMPSEAQNIYKSIRSDIILGANLDFQNPEVREEMIRWTKWLINEVGLDGFRIDAVRHIDTPFISEWAFAIQKYMSDIGKFDGMLMFGESWDGWAERLSAYLEGNPANNGLFYNQGDGATNYCGIGNAMSLFDVPLHYDFQKVAKENNSYPPTRISDLPYRGLLARNPRYAITFVDNHDTIPTQELGSYIPLHTKLQAYTFILLNEFGVPTVYYEDMYKGNFVSNYKHDNFHVLNEGIKKLVYLRRRYAYGPGEYFIDYAKPGILGYKRQGRSDRQAESGLIYLIREFNSKDNGLIIPTDNRKWVLAAGSGNFNNGRFYLNDDSDWAVWIPSPENGIPATQLPWSLK
ncbi:MAG: hypothetical protein A2504_02465 [Bdellovibrionales bacterium RIFOXYD12_FULL_39_22]|nr:MAG: hypothetical protein A2385_12495 [Bdellovibrionales bacterium RIFOXYB1_FULL_39_21]OFZ41168.1 MAG: hypothetical protein A2485_00905 [Bdellovibrionales bacterium RIFOXYC12_FULL_39_17]OFZ44922.1 MAG: hypothetical protein A2404_11650 [Bdellovibrionales bacterium RIFOXYC1_FULL_39_130]OFZ73152.1 MAG: hypothetical protein A2451_11930 [Bdellovibrionales bacterium RIFOXYC2_FULL_39_8]OFZ74369.1 MAG: hypothetical protein A2560_12020 [Bdellovibrionales bacterium RIFOXYD1_FULL_39_84]OFZ92371.1 MAG: